MKKIIIIHGPNLNMLGSRDPVKYGSMTLSGVNSLLTKTAQKAGVSICAFQSNHEGDIIDFLQLTDTRTFDGVLINPGALVRYGYSLRQALIDLGKPVVEVHMSNIDKTGVNTLVNVLDDVRAGQVVGLKEQSYIEGLTMLLSKII